MHRKYNRQKNIIGRNPEVAADHFLSKISVPLAGATPKRVTQNTVKISEKIGVSVLGDFTNSHFI